ncbi:putative oxidoreductase YjmC [Halichoeres trimaculatus]|uniref:putative oxidoreductase YjmC n=1 Tax=Halichoeres trimaculatus TaxID=147232 RepID=UPI003D9F5218
MYRTFCHVGNGCRARRTPPAARIWTQLWCLIRKEEVQSFIERCMTAVGTKQHHACSLAKVLVEGDHRGHYSHGLNRMDMYVKDIKSGICAKDGEPVLEKESAATALVDGRNLLGPVVGNFCMNLAIQKAKEVGVGWVVARGSNHYGIAGYYAMQALKENMIGMSFTNTSPLVVPTRGKACTLGTNPISVAAPAKDGDSFVLDMATSAVALGKVELHDRRNDPIPEGWGCDADGKMSTDPKKVLNGGGLVPIGGSEATGGYKGFGLGMMVEVFCGILAGAHYSNNVRTWKVTDRVADLGQCFVAINPENFAPEFNKRMSDLLSIQREMDAADPDCPVLTAGDPERMNMKKCDDLGGIPYHINVVNHMNEEAKKVGVSELLPVDKLISI